MCGICGYVNLSKSQHDATALHNMVKTLHHRGPDSQGYFEDKEHQVFLGHARLSIIDISDNGRQPMFLDNLTIVLNGEVYNYSEIKKELVEKGHTFRSSSDTEVVLHAFKEWGSACVNKFIGMFAFAIYDSEKQTITIFRDRAGVKPLYYYFDQHAFIFGSELKAFHPNPLFHKELDYDALGLYMKFMYIPAPRSVFKHTYKLLQGSYLVFDIRRRSYETQKYWDLRPYYLKPKLDILYEEAIEETERVLTTAFKYRMVSDVPVGVFLSAGFDSTCVVALLQKGMTDKLRTFTIGFENGNNEAPMAKAIASYLGTDHTEHYCSEKDALDIVKDLPYYYDEPFADNSAIPTTLVCRIARENVKVALSADGGDELFAGYNIYTHYLRSYRVMNHIPNILKKPTGHLIHSTGSIVRNPTYHRRLDMISDSLLSDKDIALSLTDAIYSNPHTPIMEIFTRGTVKNNTVYNEANEGMTVLSRLLYADYMQYLPDDILVKVDRASMSISLEGRNPFLDHHIVEFVAQLPDEYKYQNEIKKRILKDIVYKHIPRDLIDKPKTGFSVPLSRWLSEGFSDYMGHYLSEGTIKEYGVFNPDFVKYLCVEFKKNNKSFVHDIWKILQFQMWYERWMLKN